MRVEFCNRCGSVPIYVLVLVLIWRQALGFRILNVLFLNFVFCSLHFRPNVMVPLCGSFIIISATWCQRKCVYTPYGDQCCSTMFSRCANPTKRCFTTIWPLPEIVARTIRHHLVAFYCSSTIYDNICRGTTYENDTYNFLNTISSGPDFIPGNVPRKKTA